MWWVWVKFVCVCVCVYKNWCTYVHIQLIHTNHTYPTHPLRTPHTPLHIPSLSISHTSHTSPPHLSSPGMGTGGPCMEAALARRLVALRPLPLSALVGGGPGEGPQLLQVVAMSDSLDYVAACIQSGAHKHLQHARAEVWVGVLGGNRALVMMGVLCLHTCVHINQTHTHTYSLSLSLSRTHTRAHTHTLTLQQTLQQTHTHTPSQLIRLAAMRGTGPQSPTNPGADLQSISDSLEHLRHRYAMLSGYLLRAVRLEVQLFALHFLQVSVCGGGGCCVCVVDVCVCVLYVWWMCRYTCWFVRTSMLVCVQVCWYTRTCICTCTCINTHIKCIP